MSTEHAVSYFTTGDFLYDVIVRWAVMRKCQVQWGHEARHCLFFCCMFFMQLSCVRVSSVFAQGVARPS